MGGSAWTVPLEGRGLSEAVLGTSYILTVAEVGEECAGVTGPQKASYEDTQQVSMKLTPYYSRECPA